MVIKKDVRIIGFDDCPFQFKNKQKIRIVGVIYRGKDLLEGVLQGMITVDGDDATDVVIDLVKGSKFYEALKVIMLYGITVGGFNVIDPRVVYKKLNLPVIVIAEHEPDLKSIKDALTHVEGGEEKWKIIQNNSNLKEFHFKHHGNPIYFSSIGMNEDDVRHVIKFSIKTGRIPEPIRIAHIIASSFK